MSFTPPSTSDPRAYERYEEIAALTRKNTRLASALKAAQQELVSLHQQITLLNQTPLSCGIVLNTQAAKRRADVWIGGRKIVAEIDQKLIASKIYPGQEVLLNEHLVVTEVRDSPQSGEVVLTREVYPNDSALVMIRPDEEQILTLSSELSGKVNPGDLLQVDLKAKIAFRKVPKSEVNELVLCEAPDISYAQIGGLEKQIATIKDTIELPLLHPQMYQKFELKPPRGILLYGPPGCGKTMIAKAIANSLSQQMQQNHSGFFQAKTYFLNIKGPQLLNKYVGESERQIRLLFTRARELAQAGAIVVIFFDEMEALFRIRGAGKSSDIETTIVPQLLAEIDGVEQLDNVVIIGASNREDMLDPAILRPGRLDLKLHIDRPSPQGIKEILKLYVSENIPLDSALKQEFPDHTPSTIITWLIDKTCDRILQRTPDSEIAKLTFRDGSTRLLYQADLISGAVLANIVARAKQLAIKETLLGHATGLKLTHLYTAVSSEWEENLTLSQETSPQEWAKICGLPVSELVTILPRPQTRKS